MALSQGDPGARTTTHEAFQLVQASSNFNNLVRAYRACPALAELLATDHEKCRPDLAAVMVRAGDDKWARRLDLSISATPAP